MSTAPAKVIRCYLPTGRWSDITYNRDHVDIGAAGKLIAQDLTYVPELGRLVMEHTPVAGLPMYYGAVVSEAAMLALQDSTVSPPRVVLRGDKCTRSDLPGYPVFECIATGGATASAWMRAGDSPPAFIAATEQIELTAATCGNMHTNVGAVARVDLYLPPAAAGITTGEIIVSGADGIRVISATGDTVRVITAVSSAGGYAESTAIGSVLRLVAIDATAWIATTALGTWSVV